MIRALKCLNAFPFVALGWLFAHAWQLIGWGRIQGRVFGFEDARLVWTTGPVARWFAGRGWKGFTLGRNVFIWPGAYTGAELRDLLQHESEHVAQYLRYGIAFPVVYLYQLVRYGYGRKRQTHPLEVAARREAEKP